MSSNRKPAPSMVVALIALFVSLAGSATAAKVLITGKDIKDGTIQLSDLSRRTRTQLTAHAHTATRASSANKADTSTAVVDSATGNRVGLSSTPLPNSLLPLSANGSLPESVLPLDSTTKAPNVAARVYSSLDETFPIQIAGAPVQRLSYDRVSFDTAHMFDPAHPTQLRAPVPGIYLINSNVSWQVTGTSGHNRAIYVYVNGHAVSVDQRPPAQETRQVVTTLYRLAAGDVVEVGAAQDEALSLKANAVGDYAPSLAMAWIAPG